MKKLLLIVLTLLITTGIHAQMQSQTMTFNGEIRVDSTGNAIHKMSGKLTAQQWIMWNYMYGGGQASMVKKSIERTLSPYYVYDFKYNPNEMDRTFSIEYKAKGVVEYLGKDKWQANLGLRDIQPVKTSENSFTAVQSQLNGNVVLQTNTTVTLPSDAREMKFDKDEFGNVLVLYKMPTETIMSIGNARMKTAGYSLLGIGLLSLAGLMVFRKRI